MIIYLDDDFKCHVLNDGNMREIETDVFDGKCDAYIEGFRFVPEGERWIREDGEIFYGEMITPWKDSRLLETAQSLYNESVSNKELNNSLEERVIALEEENALLMECVLEISEIVYA